MLEHMDKCLRLFPHCLHMYMYVFVPIIMPTAVRMYVSLRMSVIPKRKQKENSPRPASIPKIKNKN